MGNRGKTAFNARLRNDNYDHLQKRAAIEGLSMNAMLNRILMGDRRRGRRRKTGITLASTPSISAGKG